MLRRKSVVESTRQAVGTGHAAMLQISASPGPSCFRSLPSKEAQAWPRLLNGTCTRKVTYSGRIRGRNERECGQIGVKSMPGTCNFSRQSECYSTLAVNKLLKFSPYIILPGLYTNFQEL
jgi:hypothetical protein